ncbi:MAG: exo-alpha-sialidase [Lentisphaerae bacterium]|jgi:hypothetical protein|nr:exo-alpha-sialidase [Lentisphaerota bacterium]MBT7846218.1 exo-alpha-sialidase [Lentisphaerota bacterium]
MREVCTPLTERYIAVDNVCAWPNLTRMPDGAIISTIFSQPCHGLWEGDVECWTSLDEGRTWSYRGTAAPHEPNTNRMNVAAGLAANGDLIVLASGWDDRPTIASGPGEEQEWQPAGVGRSNVLHPWVCRSADGGRTWKRDGVVEFSPRAEGYLEPVPFGDIVACGDGTLGVSVYTRKLDGALSSFFLSSRDDGQTWGECVPLAPMHNETTLFSFGDGRLLAAARSRNLDQFVSNDAGRTWELHGPLTGAGELPGHFLRLTDGRILLTYGIRHSGFYGVGARIGDPDGTTWYTPIVLVNLDDTHDGGYPSSVQSPDGTVVTAYYSRGVQAHTRYHMGVVRWDIDRAVEKNRVPENWPSP